MPPTRTVSGRLILSATLVAAVEAQQYTIFTYAGGAPAPPTAEISLATDAAGNVYFVDGLGYSGVAVHSNSVFKVDPSGAITRIAGSSRTDFSGDGGPAANASLYSPQSVAVDAAGNVFIVDSGNQRVRRVSTDGTITTVAGGGAAVLGDGGRAISGQLNYPTSIEDLRPGTKTASVSERYPRAVSSRPCLQPPCAASRAWPWTPRATVRALRIGRLEDFA